MSVVKRIKQYIDFKGITNQRFEQQIGYSNGAFATQVKNNKNIGSDKLENILNEYVDINPTWLLTGKGPMILSDESNTVNEPVAVYGKNRLNTDPQSIPLYDVEATAGIVSLFNDTHSNPIDHIRIPGIPKCDGAIPISGDSMYPLLKSGDIVLYKQVTDPLDAIYFFGEMYIIAIDQDGDNYVVVKYIHKSDKGDGYIKLVSQNQHHDPFDIPKSSIRALAIVRASIRINSMK